MCLLQYIEIESVHHHRSKEFNIFFNGDLLNEFGDITKKRFMPVFVFHSGKKEKYERNVYFFLSSQKRPWTMMNKCKLKLLVNIIAV